MSQEPVIFSRGATLRDVPLEFKGISCNFQEWLGSAFRLRDVHEQCSAYLKSLPPAGTLKGDLVLPAELVDTPGRRWHAKHIHGSRDNYGWKSL